MPIDWTRLQKRLGAESPGSSQPPRPGRLAAEARRRFDEWCERAVDVVMTACHQRAELRAAEMRAATGVRLEIARPVGIPLPGPALTGVERGVLRVALGGASVHLYATRRAGALPRLMLLVEHQAVESFTDGVTPAREGRARVVSLPAGLIDHGNDGLPVVFSPEPPGRRPLSADEIVYRIFDLLAETHRKKVGTGTRRSTRPPRGR